VTCIKCKKEIEDSSIYCRFCGKKQVQTKKKHARRPNGSGSISFRSNYKLKPYYARIYQRDKTGTLIRKDVGYFSSKSKAQLAVDSALNNGISDFVTIKVSEAYDLWKEVHYKSLTNSGEQSYNSAWTYFVNIKTMRLLDIKTEHLQNLVDNAVEQGKSRSVCEKIKQLASQLCKWGMSNDVLNKNYAEFVKLPPNDTKEKEIFSENDLTKMFDEYEKTKDKDLAAIIIMCYTGFRLNEFVNLKKTDFYNNCLHGGSKTEKGKNRTIPLPTFILPIINEVIDGTNSEYIFPNTAGNAHIAKNFRFRIYYPTLEKYGLPKLSPHSTRHTYSTLGVLSGMGQIAMQDILGHEKFETTANIYTHLSNNTDYLTTEINKLKKPKQSHP